MENDSRILVLVYLILFSNIISGEAQNRGSDCNAIYLGVDGYVPGKCVTFHECPPLKGLLRSSSLTAAELRLLQNLTCTIDPENPTICCALRDIPDLTNYNDGNLGGKIPKLPSLEEVIVYPTPAADNKNRPRPPLTSNNVNAISSPNPTKEKRPEENGDSDVSFRKFALLPKLDKCGLAEVDSSLRIVGGKDAEHGAYPWMARIGYRSLDTGDIEFYCGATVISHKYILTAAHCSEEVDKTEYELAIVRLGEHDTNKEMDCSPDSSPIVNCSRYVDLEIEKVIHHPGYNLENKTNDIELIRVKGNIPFNTPFVKPICLPFVKEYGISEVLMRDDDVEHKNQFVGKKGVVTGWGRVKWNKVDGSEILQEIKLPIVSNDECQRNYSTKITLWDKQMCAGGVNGEDSCGGDSGGPIVIPIPMKVNIQSRLSSKVVSRLKPIFFQLGVVSFGPTHCGVGGLPGVYTRVSAYRKWILDNIEP